MKITPFLPHWRASGDIHEIILRCLSEPFAKENT